MKKLSLFSILALLCALASYAQMMPIVISGYVLNNNGNTVMNQVITITSDSSIAATFQYTGTAVSNSQGFYADTIPYPMGLPQGGSFKVSTTGCGQVYTKKAFFNANNSFPVVNFVICGFNPTGCQAGFKAITDSMNPNYVVFYNTSSGGTAFTPLTYSWNFGDGGISSQANPVHYYTNAGAYSVSLTISGANCSSTFTDSVLVQGSVGSCQALFTSSPVPGAVNTVSFINMSTASSPNTTYTSLWSFGDNTTSTSPNPTHSYAQNGLYNVTLTITDATGCTNTYSYLTLVGGLSSCQASFFPVPDSTQANTIMFYNASTVSSAAGIYSSFWTFGDGAGSTAQYPTHTYAQPGVYTACLVIQDSLTNCTDSVCMTVVVQGAPSCQAMFAATTIPNSLMVSFNNLSQTVSGNVQYTWSFGDGTSSTQFFPSHTYAQSGTYIVTLSLVDGTGCTSTYSDSISVNFTPLVISGNIFAGNSTADYAKVWLVSMDSSLNLFAADSVSLTPSDSGQFSFANYDPSRGYTVKAALSSTSANYASFLPTYFGQTLFWGNAQWFAGVQPIPATIYLLAGANAGGPGFISGSIFAGANKTSGAMVEKAQVMLLDMNNAPVQYTYSDANGEYSFSNVAYGQYKVYVEIIGKPSTPATVSLSQMTPSAANVNFEVRKAQVSTVADKAAVLASDLVLAPNPTSDIATLNIELAQPATLRVELRNVLGATVQSVSLGNQSGASSHSLSLESLPAGIYLLTLYADGASAATLRVVKQ